MASNALNIIEYPDVSAPANAPVRPVRGEPVLSLKDWQALDHAAFIARWDALAEAAGEPNPFHESWYLLPALRALSRGGKAGILVLETDGFLLGLLPFTRSLSYYGHPLPHMRNWMHGNCFLGAPLVAAGAEGAFWRKLLDWADENARHALYLHLDCIPLATALHASLAELLRTQGRPAALVHREERAMLASTLTPDAYFENALAGKKRKELRRQYNRLSELGAVTFRRERTEAGLTEWTSRFLDLERSGWKGAAGSAMACAQGTLELLREALAGAAARGRLERLSLELDGRPIAMLASFLTPPGAFSYKTAFDESFARYSPGVLLQRENLALLEDDGIAWCDSCASPDHPMIDHLWRERRTIGRINIGIGGTARQALFRQIARLETGGPIGSMAL